jgi:hypothetical protein
MGESAACPWLSPNTVGFDMQKLILDGCDGMNLEVHQGGDGDEAANKSIVLLFSHHAVRCHWLRGCMTGFLSG